MGRSNAQLKAVPLVYTNQQILDAATGRWGEAANEVLLAEPYVIKKPDDTEIVIQPLTRRRRKALKAAQAAYLMLGAQLMEAQQDGTADQGTLTRIQGLIDAADERYNQALFGEDVYQQVVDFYENQQEEFYDAMQADVHAALVNRVQLPDDVCPKCQQKLPSDETEEGEAGKDESSSTSSTGTGTKSAGTSKKSST